MRIKGVALPLLAAALLVGAGAGIAGIASAQTTTSASTASGTVAAMPRTGRPNMGPHIDGTITAISGTTIKLTEEKDEGSTAYTVDASAAAVMKDGATSQLSGLAVGDKLFVLGTVDGTNVKATRIMSGMPPKGSKGFGPGWHGGSHVDGMVTAVDGDAITIAREAHEGGGTYTVDVSAAKVMKGSDGNMPVAAAAADIKVGDTISARGTVSGNSVKATGVFDGIRPHLPGFMKKAQ